MDLKMIYALAFSLTAIAILFAGIWLLYQVTHYRPVMPDELYHPLRPYLLQILGLTFILPVILVAAVAGTLNDQALSVLLGGMVAFIFAGKNT